MSANRIVALNLQIAKLREESPSTAG